MISPRLDRDSTSPDSRWNCGCLGDPDLTPPRHAGVHVTSQVFERVACLGLVPGLSVHHGRAICVMSMSFFCPDSCAFPFFFHLAALLPWSFCSLLSYCSATIYLLDVLHIQYYQAVAHTSLPIAPRRHTVLSATQGRKSCGARQHDMAQEHQSHARLPSVHRAAQSRVDRRRDPDK